MTGSYQYATMWGGALLADGSARFRLWAPAQQAVSLASPRLGARQAMHRESDGWFAIETRLIAAGEPYAFALDNGMLVPDPAARAQVGDVHGPSRLVDPEAYRWETAGWTGRPWSDAVIYELHPGTFSSEGTFAGIEAHLDHLVDLGVTAIELMPVAQFSGKRGWGYDGVLLYAPHVAYGGPEGLKRLVDRAHARGLMVLLDVVYNHFGPDGNYLHLYAPQFFDSSRQTPWGAAIDYTREPVRRFAIDNAVYWLEEYRLDGLRLDAIDQIRDPSRVHVIEAIAVEVRRRITDRHVHLTTEDERNITRLHRRDDDGRPALYTAEWNDDFHHVAHVLATAETDGYYTDYVDAPPAKFAGALAEGYVYQGQPSPFKDGAPRGEPSTGLPPQAFVNFLQNHDQIGNRAFGERLTVLAAPEAVDLLTAVLLLAPQVPLIFMGEEWGETRPFQFFTDFRGELADAVREGRRNEFRKWRQFRDPDTRARIPDPNSPATFEASRLDWTGVKQGAGGRRLELVRKLLGLRRRHLAPWIGTLAGGSASARSLVGSVIRVDWRAPDLTYSLIANVSGVPQQLPAATIDGWPDAGAQIFELPRGAGARLRSGEILPWSGAFALQWVGEGGAGTT